MDETAAQPRQKSKHFEGSQLPSQRRNNLFASGEAQRRNYSRKSSYAINGATQTTHGDRSYLTTISQNLYSKGMVSGLIDDADSRSVPAGCDT